MQAIEAAHRFIALNFPGCRAAFLGGSVVRGEATPTSDLDIVIITTDVGPGYRESCHAFGWPIEVFVHTSESYRQFFRSDVERRRPSLPRMCAEGVVLQDRDGTALHIQAEARKLLEKGPAPLSDAELLRIRYAISDVLDDFLGSVKAEETLFIAPELTRAAIDLILLHHRQWLGQGKWVPRALNSFDPHLTTEVTAALEALYQRGDKQPLARFASRALDLVGGPLFDGFSSGKAT